MAEQEKKQKPAFDKFMERYPLHFLESRFSIAFYSSSSRWGFTSVLSTVSLSFIAIAIALYAVYMAESGGCVMFAFIIAVAVIGLLGMVAIGIMSVYFMRNQNEPDIDLFIRGIMKGTSDIITDMKPPDSEVEKFGIRVGKYAKAVLDEKENRAKEEQLKKDGGA